MTVLGLAAIGSVAMAGAASVTVYLNDDSNAYTNGSSVSVQAGTGLTVYAHGDLPGWTKSMGRPAEAFGSPPPRHEPTCPGPSPAVAMPRGFVVSAAG